MKYKYPSYHYKDRQFRKIYALKTQTKIDIQLMPLIDPNYNGIPAKSFIP